MADIIIRGHELDIDILEELEQFDWTGSTVKGNKFIACSPFRVERHPSFACNLEDSTWIDSGNIDEYYHKGNFVKLLSLLRNEDMDTIEDYLIEKYATILANTEALELHLNLQCESDKSKFISKSSIQHLYCKHTDYLSKRGISKEVQEAFEIGYDAEKGCVALLWTDNNGNIINIKYRRTDTKAFFYEKDGQPIKKYVYGLYQCILQKDKRVFLCESEIDALTLWTYGFPAIAVGGSSLSENQEQLIRSAGIEELVIATDNDLVGDRFRKFLICEFGGSFTIYDFVFPPQVKDINDMTKEQIIKSVQSLEQPNFNFLQVHLSE